jgi:hypothetical protein
MAVVGPGVPGVAVGLQLGDELADGPPGGLGNLALVQDWPARSGGLAVRPSGPTVARRPW